MSQSAVVMDCHKPVKLGLPSGMRGILCGPAAVVPLAAGACPRGAAAGACPLVAGAGVWPATTTTQVKRTVMPVTRRRNVENLDFICIGKAPLADIWDRSYRTFY